MRKYVVSGLAIVALGAVISPAVGAPSLGQVASIARKALSIGNQAKSTAMQAKRTANRARRIAARKPDLGDTRRVVSSTTVPADNAQIAVARCPNGMRVISGGAFTNALYNLFLSGPDQTSTAWLAGGDNIGSTIAATVDATAYCAFPRRAISARVASGAARDQAIRAEVAALLRERRQVRSPR
jgi:hypothetical protein